MRIPAFVLALIFSSAAAAQTAKTPDSQQAERAVGNPVQTADPPPPENSPQQEAQAEENATLSLSSEELQQRPDLIVRALTASVWQNHADNTAFLLPYYYRLPENRRDPDLAEWAEAVVAHGRGDYAGAVRHYRRLIAKNPEHTAVRFRLAQALFADKQWEAAQDQFEKLRSESAEAETHVQPYLAAVRRQSRWEISGGISYLHDRNINNAPKNREVGGGWTAPAAESGQGLSYHAAVAKKQPLQQGFFGQWQLDANGRHYWDNRRYNELTVRTSLGGGRENARHSLTVAPFYEQTWYAGGRVGDEALKRFARSSGLSAQWQYRPHPNWQISLSGETAINRYRSRVHLNGRSQNASATVVYAANARQYWFGGADWGRTHTRDGDDSFIRNGIRAGWGQEWPLGLSTRISASYAHRNYRAAGFFGQRQRNKESSLTASVWHRNLHFWGITPRLTWHYQQVKSNLPLYTYAKQRAFIEVSKQF